MVKLIKIIMYVFAVLTAGLGCSIVALVLWDRKYLEIGDMIDETFDW